MKQSAKFRQLHNNIRPKRGCSSAGGGKRRTDLHELPAFRLAVKYGRSTFIVHISQHTKHD
jgi:hypothetical protein